MVASFPGPRRGLGTRLQVGHGKQCYPGAGVSIIVASFPGPRHGLGTRLQVGHGKQCYPWSRGRYHGGLSSFPAYVVSLMCSLERVKLFDVVILSLLNSCISCRGYTGK